MKQHASLQLLAKNILLLLPLLSLPARGVPFLNQDHVNLTGRFLRTDDSVRFDWPGWSASMKFSGEGQISADLDSGGNKFRVQIDGQSRIIQPEKGRSLVKLGGNLGPGEHSVRLTKITEAGSFMVPFFMNQRPAELWGFE